MIYLDTETCGLHGVAVLLQYAEDDGPIQLYDLWKHPIQETLYVLEGIAKKEICGFNLAFDWFHICKIYNLFSLFPKNWIPEDHIDEIAVREADARFGKCLKPKAALDLMLHARKGPYQSLMARKDIKIRRIPTVLAQSLATELENRIEIDGIYFARRKDKHAPRWRVADRTDDPGFKDVVLKFAPKGDLKTLAIHAGLADEKDVLRFGDVEVDKVYWPIECSKRWLKGKKTSKGKGGWAPFCTAVGKPGRWNGSWPSVIDRHISHWAFHSLARKYAEDDVTYTRGLKKFFGNPEAGDDDSELACMVGAVRWRSFAVDVELMKERKIEVLKRAKEVPLAPRRAKIWIEEVMDDAMKAVFKSTSKQALERASVSKCDCTFEDPVPEQCPICNGTRLHPSAERAQAVSDARKAIKKAELLDKIIEAGRFHASFIVIGTKSSRMSGTDGLNAQGIDRESFIRSCFTFADPDYILCGGDFDAFEVVLADASYDDPALRAELTTLRPCPMCDATGKVKDKECEECNGTTQCVAKIHALFGMEMFPGHTYAEIRRSKKYYTLGKNGVFSMIYGGDWNTLVNKYSVDPEDAKAAEERWFKKYPGIKKARQKIINDFCSMRQPGGIGTKVEWHQPADFIETPMGFRRYFTLENKICAALFDIANKPPTHWKDIKIKVVRRDRVQTAGGAVSSALYGAAFGLQGNNMRAAANHVIQSFGATITKRVQRRIWDLQPVGVSDWLVLPINIHDEVLAPCRPEIADLVKKTVDDTVESFRPKVPLIKMEFKLGMKSWAEK